MENKKFEDLFAEFEKPIYNYVLRMVKNEQLAEDLTQDIFIKVYQKLDSFRGESSLKTWIYRIATNTYLDYFRTAGHKKDKITGSLAESGDDESSFLEAEKVLSIDERLVEAEMKSSFFDFVNKLPDDYRAVLILHDFQGLKNREIAEILNVSLETVKIRLHRARKKFRATCVQDCNISKDSRNISRCEPKEVNSDELSRV